MTLILVNLPLYLYAGSKLGYDFGLITFTYYFVIATTIVVATGMELRKWRARADEDPNFDPTQTATKRNGQLVGDVAASH